MTVDPSHGMRRNTASLFMISRTTKIPSKNNNKFFKEDDFILEEDDEELNLDGLKKASNLLPAQRMKSCAIDMNPRKFSSILSKLGHIDETDSD